MAKRFAELYLMCYVFLLRMPSEALSMVVAGGTTEDEQQSVVWFDADKQELVLKLRRYGICIWCSSIFGLFVLKAEEQARGQQVDSQVLVQGMSKDMSCARYGQACGKLCAWRSVVWRHHVA